MSHTHTSQKLPTKANSDKEEVFHTVMLGRPESHEITDIFLREIQKNLHEFDCQGRDDERNYKGMSITQIKNLTNESDQHSRIAAGNRPVEIGMDQALKMNCRYFNLKGKHLNVFKL